MRGEVVSGMSLSDPPATGVKRNALGVEQPVNDPMMPIVWTRNYMPERRLGFRFAQRPVRVLTTTMGSAQDLLNEGFRRLLVNGVYWLTDLPVPQKADVRIVGDYRPSPFGFGRFKRGVKPSDVQLNGPPIGPK
jgi:hypothetical protein